MLKTFFGKGNKDNKGNKGKGDGVAPDGVAPDGIEVAEAAAEAAAEAVAEAAAPDGVAPDNIEVAEAAAPDGVAPDGVAPDNIEVAEAVAEAAAEAVAPTLTTSQLEGMPLNKGTMGVALDTLEEFLIISDMGMELTTSVVDHLRGDILTGNIPNMRVFVEELNTNLLALLSPKEGGVDGEDFCLIKADADANTDANANVNVNANAGNVADGGSSPTPTPTVAMLVGVNGVGKTTSISKLAHYAKNTLGKGVLIAAGDTYRAAAVEQLQHWGDTVGVEVVSQQHGADSAAVMYDALSKGIATGADLLLCDTSGRLQNNDNLMRELEKSARVLKKLSPNAPHHVFLVIDATLGSNSILQAQVFADYVAPTGILLTKTDAQLQPGSLFQIVRGLGLPIRYVSYGERVEQLAPFQGYAFVGDFITGFLQAYSEV